MSKAEDYYDLVNALLSYQHDTSIEELLADAITQLWSKGYDPTFCATWLVKSLRDEADRLQTFGE